MDGLLTSLTVHCAISILAVTEISVNLVNTRSIVQTGITGTFVDIWMKIDQKSIQVAYTELLSFY